MKKPFSSLSAEEVQFFLTYKESQYAIRRKRIEDFCSIQDENFGRKIIKNSLIFDKGSLKTFGSLFIIYCIVSFFIPITVTLKATEDDKISYCQIAKVASSSWCNHFIKLGEAPAANIEAITKDVQQMWAIRSATGGETLSRCWLPPSGHSQVRSQLKFISRYIADHNVSELTGRVARRTESVHCYCETPTLKIGQCLLSEVCGAVSTQVLVQGRSHSYTWMWLLLSPLCFSLHPTVVEICLSWYLPS